MSFGLIVNAILYGIIEAFSEWFPVSSEGHLLLLDKWLAPGFSADFAGLLRAVIRLGAALAVIVVCFHRMNPLAADKTPKARALTWGLWGKVFLSVLPAVAVGFSCSGWIEQHFHKNYVTAFAMVAGGFVLLIADAVSRRRQPRVTGLYRLGCGRALALGIFQILSLIPGTSWTATAIAGALLLGFSAQTAAEYSLYVAVPFLLGGSLLRIVGIGLHVTGSELAALGVGLLTAFAVSCLALRMFLGFVRSHEYSWFGHYRIYVGFLILLAFYYL